MTKRNLLHLLAIASTCWAATAYAVDRRTLDMWIDRTEHLESRGNVRAVGDNGRSRGPHQIQAAMWYAYGGAGPWHVRAHHRAESRAVTARILRACERACRRDHKAVTWRNVRWYYTHGGY